MYSTLETDPADLRSPLSRSLSRSFLSGAAVVVISSRHLRPSPATFIQDLRRGIKVDEYDIVIIGGGTAGCVLAARLSEDPLMNICLLETGESSLSLPLSRIPSAYPQLFGTDHLYNFNTVDQTNAGGFTRYFPKGKMLGGCSSVNAQIFHCGSPSDDVECDSHLILEQ
ncbi:hypothetical protein B0H15DRAFT_825788 [Mycena belliarum]|uniref:Glucose-methanol-choline oxidoreductase N-terminal domain-containing protein n=1 Tax=Mycena belliarum TaxID=1033014 RepID=A0AAD6UDG0_9AGAR|nr:hypothetical protein B0H15DRAFT_825788 [Mycena belliae]